MLQTGEMVEGPLPDERYGVIVQSQPLQILVSESVVGDSGELVGAQVEDLKVWETPQLAKLERPKCVSVQTEDVEELPEVHQRIHRERGQIGVALDVNFLELELAQHACRERRYGGSLYPQLVVLSSGLASAPEDFFKLSRIVGAHAVHALVVARTRSQAGRVRTIC